MLGGRAGRSTSVDGIRSTWLRLTAADVARNKDERSDARQVIGDLRQILAEAGVQLLRPDLVIMDEFQRFAELLDPNSTSKSAELLRTFISSEHERNSAPTKVLLLSATPYRWFDRSGTARTTRTSSRRCGSSSTTSRVRSMKPSRHSPTCEAHSGTAISKQPRRSRTVERRASPCDLPNRAAQFNPRPQWHVAQRPGAHARRHRRCAWLRRSATIG